MTSSVHDHSDSSESDDQQKHSESQIHSSSPAPGMSHPGIPGPIQYVAPPQIGAGHAVAPGAYPYPDPYYRSIFAPYDTQPYPPQPYGGQPTVHLQLMGIQQAGSRAKAESENKTLKSRKPYLHESRHQHALRRARGCGGRFLNAKKDENEQSEGNNSQAIINLNSDKVSVLPRIEHPNYFGSSCNSSKWPHEVIILQKLLGNRVPNTLVPVVLH
ncbi:hypothetical protein M0R45_013738 [Rubus argutus]|uniref:Nuclear transcription factor Y subunit n=1 Tax=Rubus argutus TaxID=59490 RepID=A0AAW1XKL7_RUBAR